MDSLSIKNNEWKVQSPDETIAVTISLCDEGKLNYAVSKNGACIFAPSTLGISTDRADFFETLSFVSERRMTINESYALLSGKRLNCVNNANELILKFKKKNHTLDLIFRAYDDGIAYRYFIPGEGYLSIYKEYSSFRLTPQTAGWAQDLVPSYESFYNYRSSEELNSGVFGMPVLIKNVQSLWALITEAAVYGDYCGSHIEGSRNNDDIFNVVFPADQINEVKSSCPFYTPWRAAIIGDKLSTIVESNLIENLNPECELVDTSWIKAGRSAWSWWSGDSTRDYETAVKYVDFAAEMGWEYYLCDAGWNEEWISDLTAYASKKNVGIHVWSHYKNLATDDEIYDKLPRWASYGIKGVKVDFFESDSQERIRLYDKIAVVCAQLRLMVNYHGATKPSGERRRWPHLMTREGVLGAEYYKWSEGPTAEHNCTVPFTRNVVGPMDYTPVTFTENKNQTTWSHQIALAVVFESGIQHLADKPEGYYSIGNAAQFLKDCPTRFDETRFLEGYPGRYVTFARRKGDNWFLGSICGGNTSRNMEMSLSFLKPGVTYKAKVYRDGDDPKDIIVEEMSVNSSTKLNIGLKTNGGLSVSFKLIEN